MARRASYHHGDLRRALIDAALALVTERGPKGFTLTEVARRAGVSTAAPYRHFVDKADLLAAVARVGFEQLHDALTEPPADGEAGEVAVELARRYVRWAIAHPDAYQVMFGADVDRRHHRDLVEAAARAFGVVQAAVAALATTGERPLDDPHALAAAFWTLSHGAATLYVGGDLGRAGVTTAPEDLAAATTTALIAHLL